MKTRPICFLRAVSSVLAVIVTAATAFSQAKPVVPPEPSIFDSWTFYIGVVAIVGLLGAAIAMRRKAAEVIKSSLGGKKKGGVTMTYRQDVPKEERKPRAPKPRTVKPPEVKEGFAALPVSSFTKLQRANAFIQLPESHDLSLINAIDQTNEESEEDAQVRTGALKLLSSFKTSNSVAAIAQMALYDLSSKLRSDAVQVLADMDHESGFETIVTCCADPTREVRASAARALFKLTFDRAQAWVRIVESGDIARMRHAARSAIEGDLVLRSFDRLVHTDRKNAYEAFALTALLVKAGEAAPVYEAIGSHRDENVRLALLHVLQVIRSEATYDGLSDLMNRHELTPKIADKVNELRSMLQMTPA